MGVSYITIDPDIFVTAIDNSMLCCQRMIEDIYEEHKNKTAGSPHTVFVVDRVIYGEYRRLAESNPYTPLGKVLQYLIQGNIKSLSEVDEDNDWVLGKVDSEIRDGIIKANLGRLGCDQSIEPQIIGVCLNIHKYKPGADIDLYLVGNDAPPPNTRGMAKDAVQHEIWKQIPWIHFIFAKDYPRFCPHDHTGQTKADNKIFEAAVREYIYERVLMRQYQLKIFPPGEVKDSLEWDVYLYQESEGLLKIIIGECKRRVVGNESKTVTPKEVRQLIEIIKNVAKLEIKRTENKLQIQIAGFIISNSSGSYDEDGIPWTREGVEMAAWEIMRDFPEKYSPNIWKNVEFLPIRYLHVDWDQTSVLIKRLRCYQFNNDSIVKEVEFDRVFNIYT